MGQKSRLKLWITISLMISLQYSGGFAFQDYNQENSNSKTFLSTISGNWEKLNPNNAPSVRIHHNMVYNSVNEKIILYGGLLDGVFGSDTWEFDYISNAWKELNPLKSPKPFGYHAMAYDSTENKVIMFGGISTVYVTGETWEYDYDTNNWTELKPSYSPTARRYHDMAYDSVNEKIILFGGKATSRSGTGLADSAETWTYDYKTNNWTELTPAISPPARSRQTIEYDPINQVFLMYGGASSAGILTDTWVYNYENNTWTEMNPLNQPTEPRYNIDIVYDVSIKKFVLFGGWNQTYAFDDTWLYDYSDNAWNEISTNFTPPGRGIDKGRVYDEVNDKIIMFGGFVKGSPWLNVNETWSLDLNDDAITTTQSTTTTTQSITTTQSTTKDSQPSTTVLQKDETSTEEGVTLPILTALVSLIFTTFIIIRKKDIHYP
ncbi:MAG: hypothetical protein GPJ54_22405 [Candidatus Heimdallarchaeota archaeon]|nr:hypothetical protein [Candidatus Heimdallarchaeota archaeon]